MQTTGTTIWNFIEKTAVFFLRLLFKAVGKELPETAIRSFLQFIRFGIVGLSNTLLSYVLYLISLLLFRRLGLLENADYLAAQVIAFVLSVLWSFYWNSKLVFTLENGAERSVLKALVKTFVSYSFTGLFLSSFLLFFWVRILYISEFLAPMINLIISVPLNFIINKYWAFKNSTPH